MPARLSAAAFFDDTLDNLLPSSLTVGGALDEVGNVRLDRLRTGSGSWSVYVSIGGIR